jgi:hypothetical protein
VFVLVVVSFCFFFSFVGLSVHLLSSPPPLFCRSTLKIHVRLVPLTSPSSAMSTLPTRSKLCTEPPLTGAFSKPLMEQPNIVLIFYEVCVFIVCVRRWAGFVFITSVFFFSLLFSSLSPLFPPIP